jgi:hypothetical protein
LWRGKHDRSQWSWTCFGTLKLAQYLPMSSSVVSSTSQSWVVNNFRVRNALKVIVLCGMPPCILVNRYQCFGGTSCLHRHGRRDTTGCTTSHPRRQ